MALTIADWADAVLKDLGIAPSSTDITTLSGWAAGEGGGTAAQSPNVALYNPLNTTLAEPGSSDFAPGSSVQSYTTPSEGAAAAASTLSEPAYATIVGELAGNASPQTVWDTVDASPWGTEDLGTMTVASAQSYASTPLTGTATLTGISTGDLLPVVGIGEKAAKGAAGKAVGGIVSEVEKGIVSGVSDLVDPIIHPLFLGLFAILLLLIGLYLTVGRKIAPSAGSGGGGAAGAEEGEAAEGAEVAAA